MVTSVYLTMAFPFYPNYNNSFDDLTYSNKVDFLDGDVQFGSRTRWGNVTIIQEGYPVNSFFLYQADGFLEVGKR